MQLHFHNYVGFDTTQVDGENTNVKGWPLKCFKFTQTSLLKFYKVLWNKRFVHCKWFIHFSSSNNSTYSSIDAIMHGEHNNTGLEVSENCPLTVTNESEKPMLI